MKKDEEVNTRDTRKIQYGIILFNITVLLYYLFIFIDVKSKILYIVGIFVLAIYLMGTIVLRYVYDNRGNFQNIHLLLFGIIIFFCFLETMKFFPGLIPLQIRNYLEENEIQKIRGKVVEYLDQSPFAKFKPNVIVASQGHRGTNMQFVYQWETDKLGFKNPKEILENGQIEIVALGDSFTEGMGVAVEDTWPSILTKRGRITYNLGVQGYAPIQLEGSFRLYGYKLKPRYVIIGYCADTYMREVMFFDERLAVKEKKLWGGIASVAAADGGKEIRKQTKHVTIAIFLLIRDHYFNMKYYGSRYKNHNKYKNQLYRMYAYEILPVESDKINAAKIESSLEYKKTLSAFLNIKKLSNEIGAKLILIYLPYRGYMYYEKATGKELPKDNCESIESQLLKNFCDKEGIIYLNPSNRIHDYVKNLKKDEEISLYPYLELDGHMSRYGNQLVAEEILAYLNNADNLPVTDK